MEQKKWKPMKGKTFCLNLDNMNVLTARTRENVRCSHRYHFQRRICISKMNTRRRFVLLSDTPLQRNDAIAKEQAPGNHHRQLPGEATATLLHAGSPRSTTHTAKEQPLQDHRRQLLHEATTTIPTAWQATIMGQRPQQRLQQPEKVIFQAAPGELVGPGNSPLRSYPK